MECNVIHPFGDMPRLFPRGVKEVQIDDARHFNHLLDELRYHAEEFRLAVRLLDYCNAGCKGDPFNTYGRWRWIAARDAAITVYNFKTGLEAMKRHKGKIDEVRAHANHKMFKDAVALFDETFPHAVQMRHAVAHDADQMATVDKVEKNSHAKTGDIPGLVVEGGAGVMLGRSLMKRTLGMPWEGQYIKLDVTFENADLLEQVRKIVFEALEPAAAAVVEAGRNRQKI
jgi:hypothetical protein